MRADRKFADLDAIVKSFVAVVPKPEKKKKKKSESEEGEKAKRRFKERMQASTREMVRLEYFTLPLPEAITHSHIQVLIKNFKKGRVLERKNVREILNRFASVMADNPAVQEIEIPPDGSVCVVGDTHGQLADLLTILRLNGMSFFYDYILSLYLD